VRPLVVIPAAEPSSVFAALALALSGDGPAILPVDSPPSDASSSDTSPSGLPAQVENRVALVIETSGSTGNPKRVALSADAVLASAAASDSSLGGPGQWLLALPVHYVAGINVLVRSLAAQTEPVMLAPGHFEPSEFAAAALRMDAERRYTSVVPAQLSSLLEAADADFAILEQLRRFDGILVGGQATRPELVERALELGLNLTRTYGSSETSGGCVYDGVPIGSAKARVRAGEIELSGPMLAEGYLHDPARTDASFYDDDGSRWYRTGDTGTVVDGVVSVTGRIDGLIISGGVKVSLDEVERFVRSLAGLSDAVVVRAPSERWGEVPVVITAGTALLDTLRADVASALGRAAAPAAVVTVAELPMLASGKPDRVALARLARSSDR
jgi:O-succinylbenzoic acid--CoA ligase